MHAKREDSELPTGEKVAEALKNEDRQAQYETKGNYQWSWSDQKFAPRSQDWNGWQSWTTQDWKSEEGNKDQAGGRETGGGERGSVVSLAVVMWAYHRSLRWCTIISLTTDNCLGWEHFLIGVCNIVGVGGREHW